MIFGLRAPLQTSVRLDGTDYLVYLPEPDGSEACVWALQDEWLRLFPRALPEDQQAFWDDLLTNPETAVSYATLRPIAFRLAQQLYGVPWWTAHRLTESAAQSLLAYEAWTVRKGFDPAGKPARRIIASVVAWQAEQWADEAEAKSWHQRMFMPPPGVRI
ncbi:hypothetical protein [Streptomyces sp. NPDC001282]|uniref:hypothetical protein n=1 Tax=Streptomyces sp. NPDC001282 TaxID=3364557 RepID=UPI0036A695E9